MCPSGCWVLGPISPGQNRVTELSSPERLCPGGWLSQSPAPSSSSVPQSGPLIVLAEVIKSCKACCLCTSGLQFAPKWPLRPQGGRPHTSWAKGANPPAVSQLPSQCLGEIWTLFLLLFLDW